MSKFDEENSNEEYQEIPYEFWDKLDEWFEVQEREERYMSNNRITFRGVYEKTNR